tara:strand:- start:155 stop:937 length:783 start_codon:yes stop_codon:yes gene_type:complete
MTDQTDNSTEVGIDTEIAETYGKLDAAREAVAAAQNIVHRRAGDEMSKRYGNVREWGMSHAEAISTLAGSDPMNDALVTLTAAQDAAREAREVFEAADAQYGGWNRFFLVTSSVGHIHSTMSCSSCNPYTRFAWLTDMSGLTATATVEAHGERMCTVCFPDAPVAWSEGYFVSQKADAKAERAAAKVAKAEAKAAKAAKRAETYHYYTRFIRADGTVINHDDQLTTLKAGTKSVKAQNEAHAKYGRDYLIDANTGEVVAS